MSQPLKLFISYARKDASFKDDFLLHLKPLLRKGGIQSWHDSDILASEEWETGIKENLESADVLIFLVSPAFMASDYINDIEIQKAMERYQRKEVSIVPIWIKPVAVPDDFLNKFQSLPKDRKPVSQWADQDEAWVDVVQRLNQLFNKLNNPTSNTSTNSTTVTHSSTTDEQQNTAFSKSNIRDLIGKGKTKDALHKLLTHTERGDSDLHNALTVLSSRYNDLDRSSRLGIVGNEESRLERNRINMALLSMLDDLE